MNLLKIVTLLHIFLTLSTSGCCRKLKCHKKGKFCGLGSRRCCENLFCNSVTCLAKRDNGIDCSTHNGCKSGFCKRYDCASFGKCADEKTCALAGARCKLDSEVGHERCCKGFTCKQSLPRRDCNKICTVVSSSCRNYKRKCSMLSPKCCKGLYCTENIAGFCRHRKGIDGKCNSDYECKPGLACRHGGCNSKHGKCRPEKECGKSGVSCKLNQKVKCCEGLVCKKVDGRCNQVLCVPK